MSKDVKGLFGHEGSHLPLPLSDHHSLNTLGAQLLSVRSAYGLYTGLRRPNYTVQKAGRNAESISVSADVPSQRLRDVRRRFRSRRVNVRNVIVVEVEKACLRVRMTMNSIEFRIPNMTWFYTCRMISGSVTDSNGLNVTYDI